jgi:FtsZ-binding cell division protein ZapB
MMFGNKTPSELARLELEAFQKRAAKLEALHRAEATAGADALLAGGDAAISQAADTITKAAAEVRVIEAGIRGLREQRAAALAAELRRQAESLRSQANEKRRQHADLASRGRKLLAELGRIEQVAFEGLPPTTGLPRSIALLEEAAAAEREAARIENEGLPAAGEARTETLADLLPAVTAQGDRALYPEFATIEDWARGCEAALNRIAPTLMNAPRTYRLAWRRGAIDTGASSLWVAQRYFRPTGEGDLIEPAA